MRAAVCRHDHWSITRRRPAAPTRARASPSSSAARITEASESLSPGSARKQVRPWAPATSGRAPPVVATSGVPQAMASMAGSENPSYSDGTTASSAWPYSSTIRSSASPDTKVTAPSNPRSARVRLAAESGLGCPITTSSTWRSVRSLATASSR